MLRGDEIGLFWEEIIPVKEPKIIPSREPVVLKPYVARTPIPFAPLTDEELVLYKGSVLVFDTECFNNFFLIAFKHLKTKTDQHLLAAFHVAIVVDVLRQL